MKSGIRNLLLASCFLFAVAYDCCTLGVDYDRRNKLYPEHDAYSCIVISDYGKRWVRLGRAASFLGASLIVAAFVVWGRERRRGADKGLSILIREE